VSLRLSTLATILAALAVLAAVFAIGAWVEARRSPTPAQLDRPTVLRMRLDRDAEGRARAPFRAR
jgi:hypothetical protein